MLQWLDAIVCEQLSPVEAVKLHSRRDDGFNFQLTVRGADLSRTPVCDQAGIWWFGGRHVDPAGFFVHDHITNRSTGNLE